MWNQTCPPQHMNQSTSYAPNKDIPVRIDDTNTVNVEHENMDANIEYDPNCRARTSGKKF